MKPLETKVYKGYKIHIYYDENPPNPRTDWDNAGKMVCFHRKHLLGDKTDITREELKEIVERKDVVALPLYLYDHGGLAMRTGKFYEDSGGWDTSMVGYIFIDYSTMLDKLTVQKEITPELVTRARDMLENEVETYNQYLQGEVYGFIIEDPYGKKDEAEAKYGFFGSDGEKEMQSLWEDLIDRTIDLETIFCAEVHELEVGVCEIEV
ncbi:MAG: hypothetical protein Q7T04_02335 [Dehalococcoidia bacterium]|nr:hypothetical protein [Dehalococcoidia bacterium]